MKIFCVRIGEKYGQEYETYINEKLSRYDITWIREPFDSRIKLQWNKMYAMSLDIDEPVCVIDIDLLLVNNYLHLFEYVIQRGEFLSIPAWWKDSPGYSINGGFFKYYPKDCNYIYEKFMSDPEYWQEYYIKNETTVGPVNGEQYFVEDSVKERLNLKTVPMSWVARWSTGYNMTEAQYSKWQYEINQEYTDITGNDYLYLDKFHPDIKLIHFTHSQNKPTDWKYYK